MKQRSRMYGPLIELESAVRETWCGDFDFVEFRNLTTHRSAFAIVRGELEGLGGDEPLLARVHSSCVTSEFFGACDCDCAAQLDGALAAIAAEGRGVVFYLPQEGRGAGLVAKARDRMIVQASHQRTTTFEAYERMGLQPDVRRYDEVAAMAHLLDISAPFVLLTNNPDKVEALEREKLRIAQMQPLERAAQPFNAHYLSSKRRSGHQLAEDATQATAELPGRVEELAPTRLPGRPDIARVAEYLLPMARPAAGRSLEPEASTPAPTPVPLVPIWMRLHLYVDVERGGEIIVLTCDRDPEASPLARIHAEPLLDRFPLREAPARASWESIVRAIDEHGRGVVVFASQDARGVPLEDPGVLVDVLRHHLGDAECLWLVDDALDGEGRPPATISSSGTRSLHTLLGAASAGLER